MSFKRESTVLAFIVGTIYLAKNQQQQKPLSVFSFNTPRALFMSLVDENSISIIDHHKRFIEVRDSRIKFEDELPPSFL